MTLIHNGIAAIDTHDYAAGSAVNYLHTLARPEYDVYTATGPVRTVNLGYAHKQAIVNDVPFIYEYDSDSRVTAKFYVIDKNDLAMVATHKPLSECLSDFNREV